MKPILLCLLLLWSTRSLADVYAFPDREIHLSTAIANQVFQFGLRDNGTNKSLNFQPNMGGLIVPRITYRDLWGLSWAFDTKVGENQKLIYGETKYTDIRFDFSFKSFAINTYYSQYRGLYIDNSEAVDPSLTLDDPRIQKPNMYARGFGASMTWVWNEERFSLPNLISQSQRQEKMGGSFLFGGSISEALVSDDSAFIPPNIQNQFEDIATLKEATFKSIEVKAGYGYAFARKWFFGAAAQLGPGLTHKKLVFEDGRKETGFDPSVRFELLLSGGYNGDVFFSNMRIDAKQDYIFLSGSSTQLSASQYLVSLGVGVHLDTIGI